MHPIASRFVPLAILAAAGIAAAGWTAWRTAAPRPAAPPEHLPQQGPWEERISASGLIEGDGNDTVVGVPESGLVAEVLVAVGQRVAAGQTLLRLDGRQIEAERAVAVAQHAVALADRAEAAAGLARLRALPRREDAGPAQARVGVALAQLTQAQSRTRRLAALGERGVAGELEDAGLAESAARAALAAAEAELAHAVLPAWTPELDVAQARLLAAEARVQAAQARIDEIAIRLARLVISAPRAGTVVASAAMAGQVAAPDDRDLVVLADLDRLLVRVEVDESQAWRLAPGLPGRAWLRGDRGAPVALEFVRIEPRAEPRRALPGKPGERLDGRAVQVLYRLADPPPHLRPGMLLEVDLRAAGADHE